MTDNYWQDWIPYGHYIRGRGIARLRFIVVASSYEEALLLALKYVREHHKTGYLAIDEDSVDVKPGESVNV